MRTYHKADYEMYNDNFCLQFALKCLKSTLLEKRFHGLSHIDLVVTRCRRSAEHYRDHFQRHESQSWMSIRWLVDWIGEHRILEDLFNTTSTRADLIEKCHKLVTFIADNDALTPELVGLIWACQRDTYLVDSIYGVILKSVHAWDPSLVLKLWDTVKTMPYSNWDSGFTNFVFGLARAVKHGRGRQKIKDDNVLGLFWIAMKDTSGAPIPVAKAAMEQCVTVIQEFGVQVSRTSKFYSDLFANIGDDSAGQVIWVLGKVIEEFHQQHLSHDVNMEYTSRTELIRAIDRSTNLRELLVDELCRYKQACSDQIVVQLAAGMDSGAVMESLVHPKGRLLTHFEQLDLRLDFLLKSLCRLPPSRNLSTNMAELLWVHLYASQGDICVLPEEQAMCLHFFTELPLRALKGETEVLPTATAEYIFLKHLQFEQAPLSLAAFRCFQVYFCAVNSPSLQMLGSRDGREVAVCDFAALQGLPTLWRFVLDVQFANVFEEASRFLILLYTNVTQRLRRELATIHHNFVDRVVQHLAVLRPSLTDEEEASAVKTVDLGVILLKRFLAKTRVQYDLAADIIRVAEVVDTACPEPRTEAEKESQIQVMEFMAVSATVAAIALERAKWQVQVAMDVLMDPGQREFVDAEALSYKTAEATREEAPKEELEEVTYVPPAQYLVDSQPLFDIVLGLLDADHIDRDQVWTIVDSLPANGKIVEELEQLRPSYKELLSFQSVFKLLYSLRIIEELAMPAQGPSEASSPARAWCKRFFSMGGVTHLYDLVRTLDQQLAVDSSVHKSCLILLLQLLHFFLGASSSASRELPGLFQHQSTTDTGNILALSTGSQANLRSSIDFIQYVEVLLSLCQRVLEHSLVATAEEADNQLVEHALFLVGAAMSSQPQLMAAIIALESLDFSQLVLSSLLRCPVDSLRDRFARGWRHLAVAECAADEQHPVSFFLALTLAHFPFGGDPTAPVDEFANFLAFLLEQQAELSLPMPSSQEELFVKFTAELIARPGDTSDQPASRDTVLGACLVVLTALVRLSLACKTHAATSLLLPLFHMVVVPLLPTSSSQAPMSPLVKCMTARSRLLAFSLLSLLVVDAPANFELILELLQPYAAKRPTASRALNVGEARAKYMGMRNLGSTCYANSLMQQFYMIPRFTQSLFRATPLPGATIGSEEEDATPDNDSAGTSSPPSEASLRPVLNQTLLLFAHLHSSAREYYDPSSLLQLFKTQLDIGQQQDADEFFGLITDRLSEELKSTNQPTLLNEFFQTKLRQEVICSRDPSHVSVSAVECNRLTVEVFKAHTLHEALDKYFEGESIENFKCESCAQSVVVTREFAIEVLPKHLVFNVSRFLFSVQGIREKVSKRFEYPMQLDMTPYMRPGVDRRHLPARYCHYQLAGVVVHSGTIDAGHYYSFIKDRAHPDVWYRFDDKTVSPFDPADLAAETFGGTQDWRQYNEREIWKNRNVYMLFYDQESHAPPLNSSTVDVPEPLAVEIVADNHLLLRERLSFDSSFEYFVREAMDQFKFEAVVAFDSSSLAWKATHFLTQYVFQHVRYLKAETTYPLWLQLLSGYYSRHPPACKWLLSTLAGRRREWLDYHLLSSHDHNVRVAFQKLLLVCIQTLLPLETPFFVQLALEDTKLSLQKVEEKIIPPPVEEADDAPGEVVVANEAGTAAVVPQLESLRDSHVLLVFFEHLLAIMEETREHWRRFHQYWMLFEAILDLSHEVRTFFNSRQLLYRLIEYYMGEYSPLFEHSGIERVHLGIKQKESPLLLEFMSAYSHMLCALHTRATLHPIGLPVPVPTVVGATAAVGEEGQINKVLMTTNDAEKDEEQENRVVGGVEAKESNEEDRVQNVEEKNEQEKDDKGAKEEESESEVVKEVEVDKEQTGKEEKEKEKEKEDGEDIPKVQLSTSSPTTPSVPEEGIPSNGQQSALLASHVLPPTSYADCPLLPRDEEAEKLFFRSDVFQSILKQAYNPSANRDMCAHVTWEDYDRSVFVVDSLAKVLEVVKLDKLSAVLTVYDKLLTLSDSLQLWRVAYIFFNPATTTGLLPCLKLGKFPPSVTTKLAEFVLLQLQHNPVAAGYLARERAELHHIVLDSLTTLIQSLNRSPSDEELTLQLTDITAQLTALLETDFADIAVVPYPSTFSLPDPPSPGPLDSEDD
eukprot:TRINITY_DN218_c0_g1_i1.p1 TRINITY_DN218_c0_g1~~TRINITY_DN218_c0_g1_i1.p1  ORF type:complete len:2392 (+),score=371.06 TRINITY_DN218_c0_g1_i1:718-7176(+)